MALHEVDLFHLTSYADVIRKTQAFAENSKDEWIIGDGWDQNLWPSRAFPTHEALTQALPNRPVIPPFPGGRIIRDEATGLYVRDESTREFAQRLRSPNEIPEIF